jgi:hypothetical protein
MSLWDLIFGSEDPTPEEKGAHAGYDSEERAAAVDSDAVTVVDEHTAVLAAAMDQVRDSGFRNWLKDACGAVLNRVAPLPFSAVALAQALANRRQLRGLVARPTPSPPWPIVSLSPRPFTHRTAAPRKPQPTTIIPRSRP